MKKLFIVVLLFQGTIFTADQELPELPIDRIFPLTSYRPERLYGPAYWQRQINMRAGLEVIKREETEERGLQYAANLRARECREERERIAFDKANLADLKRKGKETFFVWVLRKNVTSFEDVAFFFRMDMIRILYEKSIHAMIQHLFKNPEDVCMLEGALCCSMEEKEKNKLEALSESAREVYEDKQKVLKTSFYKLVPVALQDPQFVDAIQQAEIGIKMRIERDTSFTKDLRSGWPNYQRYLSTKKTTDGWACVIL